MQFDRTRQALERARRFGAELDELCRRAAPWPGEAAALGELRDAYARRMAAFFHEGHRFSLAVIGQVKAGKSTFLNTLLFGGRTCCRRPPARRRPCSRGWNTRRRRA